MSIKRSVIAAIAALAFSLPANADPGSTVTKAPASPSTFTVLAHGGFGGGFGGGHIGGGMGMHSLGFGGIHPGGFGPHFGPGMGSHFGFGPHRGFFPGGHRAFFHGRHGFFRHGRFFPFGVGFYGYGYGGSCYGNCIAAGYGPGYCSVYSWNFCY